MPFQKTTSLVLVSPQNAGNIGAVARSMMNFGFESLILVTPETDPVSKEALDRAVHAKEILLRATIAPDLPTALQDFQYVVGTCGRDCTYPPAYTTPRQFVEKWNKDLKLALVFGRENHGLSTEELGLCDEVLIIPTSDVCPSINLSHAVSVVLYEFFLKKYEGLESRPLWATHGEKEGFYSHLRELLLEIEFLDSHNPDPILQEIKSFFSRTGLTRREVTLFRGIIRNLKYRVST